MPLALRLLPHRRPLGRVAAILLLAILIVGCGTVPVMNIDNAPVVADRASYDTGDVRRAIMKAGIGLGWEMQRAGNNTIDGTLRQRDAVARIKINYSRASYSIRYADSENLKYDSSSRTIRGGYNRWIRHLDQAIRRELIAI